MALLPWWTPADEAEAQAWLATRPPAIQAMAQRVRPGRLYFLKTAKQRVYVHSYNEDGTVTVSVDGDFNAVLFERNVFGIKLDDLEECDLPTNGTLVGSADVPTEVMVALAHGKIAAVCAVCRAAWDAERCLPAGHAQFTMKDREHHAEA